MSTREPSTAETIFCMLFALVIFGFTFYMVYLAWGGYFFMSGEITNKWIEPPGETVVLDHYRIPRRIQTPETYWITIQKEIDGKYWGKNISVSKDTYYRYNVGNHYP